MPASCNGQLKFGALIATMITVFFMAAMVAIFLGPLIQCAPVLPSRTKYEFQRFDSATWRSDRGLRVNMLYDLLFWHKLDHLSRQEVNALLGTPDGPGTKLTGGALSSDDTYMLSGLDYLKIVYDSKGRVQYVLSVPGSSS